MPSLGDITVAFSADVSNLTSGILEAKVQISGISSTAEDASTSFLGHIGKMAGSVLDFGSKIGQTVFGLQGLYQGAVSLGQAFLGPNASMEQTDVAFETLLGKGKATQDFLGQLQQFAAATPFEFPQLATDAEHMLAFGFSAKSVIPTLTNIGDAMGSMGKSNADIDHVVEIFGQMHAAGKLNAGDMMQLSQEGIPVWKMLADAMHKTVPEVQKLSSQGLIPADKAIQAVSDGMHKMFGGGMAAQAQTFNGLLSTFQDNISAAWRAFTGPLFDMAKQGLTQLGNLVSSPAFAQFASTLGNEVGHGLATFIGWLKQASGPAQDLFVHLKIVGENLFALGQTIVSGVMPLLAPFGKAFEQIGGAFSGLQSKGGPLVNIFGSIDNAFEVGIPAIADFLKNLQPVANLLAEGLTVALSILIPLVEGLISGIAQLTGFLASNSIQAQIVKDLMIGIGVAIATIQIGAFIATIPALVAGFIAWGIAAWSAAVATIAATWPILAIGAAIAIVVGGIILAVQHWGEISKWLQGAWSGIVGFFGGVWSGIQGIFGGIGNWFQGRFSDAHKGATSAWGATTGFFQGLWNGIVDGVKAFGQAIVGAAQAVGKWLVDTWHAAVAAVVGAFQWLYDHNYYFQALVDTIRAVVTGVTQWLQSTWKAVSDWVVGVWNGIVSVATTVWNAISGAITGAVTAVGDWLRSAWNAVASWLGLSWKATSDTAGSTWKSVSDAIMGPINAAIGWLHSVWNAATAWLGGVWNGFVGLAQAAWSAVSGVFAGIWTNYIAGPLGDLWNSISGWFGNLAQAAIQWGANIITGILNGIKGAIGQIGNFLHGALGGILGNLGFHGLPGFAMGGTTPGGPILVGERGPEILSPPSGYTVTPLTSSALFSSVGSSGGGDIHVHNHIYLDGKEVTNQVMTRAMKEIRRQGVKSA